MKKHKRHFLKPYAMKIQSYTRLLLIALASLLITSCGGGGNDSSNQGGLQRDRSQKITVLNNSSSAWKISYGIGERSDQYRINGILVAEGTESEWIQPGGTVALNWQGSDKSWTQELLFTIDRSGTATRGRVVLYGNYSVEDPGSFCPNVANVNESLVYVCPDQDGVQNPLTVNAAIQVALSSRLSTFIQGSGFIELRDRVNLPDMKNWMGNLSDSLKIGEFNIPGTHDTATFAVWDEFGKTQYDYFNFTHQLEWGIRAMDLRLDANMQFRHGISVFKEKIYFNQFLEDATVFLEAHPSEFIVAFVTDEECGSGAHWTQNFQAGIAPYWDYALFDPDLENLTIGQLRKKIVFVSRQRDPGQCGYMVNAPQISWPNNTTTNNTSYGVAGLMNIALSDVYNPISYAYKITDLYPFLQLATVLQPQPLKWYVSFTSGYMGIPEPLRFAKIVVPALWQLMLGGSGDLLLPVDPGTPYFYEKILGYVSRTGRLGIVMMDAIHAHNTLDIRNDLMRRNMALLPK